VANVDAACGPANHAQAYQRNTISTCSGLDLPHLSRSDCIDLWSWLSNLFGSSIFGHGCDLTICYLDHDFSLSEPAPLAEPFDISVRAGDRAFDPNFTGAATISLDRTIFTVGSAVTPREQINSITSFIDGANVYESDASRAAGLRDLSSNGLLRTSSGGSLMPLNTTGLANDNGNSLEADEAFVAGDIHANEQIGLTATHTLFVREHNRIATDLASRIDGGEAELIAKRDASIAASNGVDSEADFIYQSARKLVGAQIQKITYDEFLPVLLGKFLTSKFCGIL
jgi:hypothetical protein